MTLADGAPVDRAAALFRTAPLRWLDGDSDRDSETALESGWFFGADECARAVAPLAGLERLDGGAFGRRWPVLAGGGGWLAPGLPMAVGAEPASGVDGEYRRVGSDIWREAGGVEAPVLTTAVDLRPPGSPFDLLWFGDHERFVVRGGSLEIENLFALVRGPVTHALLDRLLIRPHRIGDAAISNIAEGDSTKPQTVVVRRPGELSATERWRDPAHYLGVRTGVESTQRLADVVEAEMVGGERAVFRASDAPAGWRLDLAEGRFPFTALSLRCEGGVLTLSATLDRAIDATTPSVRARLAFDLRSDLVALG